MPRTHAQNRSQLLEKLLPEVVKMRQLQHAYFNSRSREVMRESIEQERKVDRILDDIKTATAYARGENPAQAGLFE